MDKQIAGYLNNEILSRIKKELQIYAITWINVENEQSQIQETT